MYQLKKFDLTSVALFSFFIFLILSFILMLPFGLLGLFFSNIIQEVGFPNQTPIDADPFSLFSGVFLIIIPIIYAIFGTIINLIVALIYNLLSLKFGGIKFSVHKLGGVESIAE